jgi:hypothetical protein
MFNDTKKISFALNILFFIVICILLYIILKQEETLPTSRALQSLVTSTDTLTRSNQKILLSDDYGNINTIGLLSNTALATDSSGNFIPFDISNIKEGKFDNVITDNFNISNITKDVGTGNLNIPNADIIANSYSGALVIDDVNKSIDSPPSFYINKGIGIYNEIKIYSVLFPNLLSRTSYNSFYNIKFTDDTKEPLLCETIVYSSNPLKVIQNLTLNEKISLTRKAISLTLWDANWTFSKTELLKDWTINPTATDLQINYKNINQLKITTSGVLSTATSISCQ